MKERRIQMLDDAMGYITVALAFLLPLFYLPITTEFYEFNKLALLTAATMVMAIIWAAKIILAKKVNIVRSKVNLSMFILLVVVILSTVFSLSPTISMYGKYGRWFPSLYAMVTLAFFYYIVASNVTKEKLIRTILLAFATGVTLASIISLLSYFGIYIGQSPYMQSPNFTTTGSAVTTAILASLATITMLSNLIYSRSTTTKILLIQAIIVNLLVVVLYSALASWAVLVIGVSLLFIFTSSSLIKQNTYYLTALLGVTIAIVFVVMFPTTNKLISNDNFRKEITLDPQTSWRIASSTVTDYPLLGAGPSTFGLNFPRYRPLSMNATDEWNVRFDKPTNELFNTIGSFGIVGSLIAIFFVVQVVRVTLKTGKDASEKPTNLLLGILLVSLITIYIFTYAGVMTSFLFFLLLALLVSQSGDHAVLLLTSMSSRSFVSSLSDEEGRKEILHYIAVPLLLTFVGIWGFYTYRVYSAEYQARNSISAAQKNDGSGTYVALQNAINLYGRREEYQNTYAQTNIALAGALATKQNLTDTDRQTISQLISQAIRSSRVSTEVLNPLAVGSWEVRANVYRSLIGIAQDAEQWALGAYNSAIQLDPTNPRLRLEAGGVYYAMGDYLSAANLFRQAANLKPDYANAHYNLAQALIKLEQYGLAQRELEIAANLVPQDSPDYARVQKDIVALIALAGQQDTKPTVQQLEAQIGEEENVTVQEALTEPGEIDTIAGEEGDVGIDEKGKVEEIVEEIVEEVTE